MTLTNPEHIWSKQGPRAPDISLQNSMDLPSLTRGDLQGSICKVLANVLVQSSTGGNRKLEDNSEYSKKTRNDVDTHLCKSGFAWACQINVVRISNQTRPWQSTVQECSIHQASGHLAREENFRVTSRILLSGSSQKPANQAVQSKLEKIQEDLI